MVSVPSRGLSYLNEQRFPLFTGLNFVSVPSRGLSYLNENYLTVEEVIACFRPLTGTLLSKQKDRGIRQRLQRVSVPSRGLSYLNCQPQHTLMRLLLCFRPLTGTLLSKQGQVEDIMEKIPCVSVPSRGLSYLNTIRQFSLPKRLFSLVCVANDILMIKEFNVFI